MADDDSFAKLAINRGFAPASTDVVMKDVGNKGKIVRLSSEDSGDDSVQFVKETKGETVVIYLRKLLWEEGKIEFPYETGTWPRSKDCRPRGKILNAAVKFMESVSYTGSNGGFRIQCSKGGYSCSNRKFRSLNQSI